MILVTNRARAYVNFGRWIADCPVDCGSALKLDPGQSGYYCPECKHVCEVEWPADPGGIWEALLKRPAPRNRNWFPAGHTLAIRAGAPHGQSVAELDAETAERMES